MSTDISDNMEGNEGNTEDPSQFSNGNASYTYKTFPVWKP